MYNSNNNISRRGDTLRWSAAAKLLVIRRSWFVYCSCHRHKWMARRRVGRMVVHCSSMIIFIITITSVQRPGHRPTAVVKMSKLDWNESEHQKRLKPRASIHQAKLDPIFMLFGDSNCTPAAPELQRRELKLTSRFVYSLNMECTRVVTYLFFFVLDVYFMPLIAASETSLKWSARELHKLTRILDFENGKGWTLCSP